MLLCDAQTSGGLLISLPADRAAHLCDRLCEAGVLGSAVIGRVLPGPARIRVLRSCGASSASLHVAVTPVLSGG